MGKAKTINCCARLTKHPKRQKNSMNMQLHEIYIYRRDLGTETKYLFTRT